MNEYLLEVKNLSTHFATYAGLAKAVDDVSFSLGRNETLGVVGESGCGKSVMARSILRLIKDPPGRITNGEIWLEGKNLLDMSEKEMQKIRGKDISMIFQEPMTALNPAFTIGYQLSEVFHYHQGLKKREALEKSVELLEMVHIPAPDLRLKEYPYQMSGGMRQRVVIAMALACRPKLILADEPTTALDVTVQAQILELITELQNELKTTMILITHDLGVIAETVQKVVVMYTGKIVEQADVDDLFDNPQHPYTQGLMKSIPNLESDENRYTNNLNELSGLVPDLTALPNGCTFRLRCPKAMDVCGNENPELVEVSKNHWGRCFLLNK